MESIPDADDNQENTKEHTLLIVDDNVDLTDYLHNTLKNKFKKIWLAFNGEEALHTCRKYQPDIVVSDIQCRE